jgi:hypothetical protein
MSLAPRTQNLELSILLAKETKGLEEDAKILVTLEEFLDGHKELSTRMPNVILVFHKFSENRFDGQESAFVKKYSNVIFVFSHFLSETKTVSRNPKKKLAALKKVIEDYNQFPHPIVISVYSSKV